MDPIPPLAESFCVGDIGRLDDEALATFVVPEQGGPDPRTLGAALRGPEHSVLARRLRGALAPDAAAALEEARRGATSEAEVDATRRALVAQLFWPLLYWCRPELYCELVDGEEIATALVDRIGVDGAVVADLGAGAGRFALRIARRARRIVAIDAVPPLLQHLEVRARALDHDNIEVRRGSLARLPMDDATVDIAVACSSLGSRPPSGGDAAVAEAVRVVRPGGEVWVIWPDQPRYFVERGFAVVTAEVSAERRFASVEAAQRLCAAFFGAEAAAWVAEHRSAEVPWSVLGMRPPADACVLRVGASTPSP